MINQFPYGNNASNPMIHVRDDGCPINSDYVIGVIRGTVGPAVS